MALECLTMGNRQRIIDTYTTYLDACSRHAWEEIPPFLAERVLVNGEARTRSEYLAHLQSTIDVFPDYRWTLRRAVIEGEWLSVHLSATGTRLGPFLWATGDGSSVETDEFDMYRVVDGLIHEVYGTADNARLCASSTPTPRAGADPATR